MGTNLISATLKSSLDAAIDDIHTTFARDIIATKKIKTPSSTVSNNDDFDYVNDKSVAESFTYTYEETTVSARIKYLDKQDIDSSFVLSQTNDAAGIALTDKYGIIRIKVPIADQEAIDEATSYTVDGFHCILNNRDQPHGVVDSKYVTYYLLRTS